MLGYHGFGANASSDAQPSLRLQPSLKLRFDETVRQASDGRRRKNAERPTPEFRSELWLASRGIPEAENLDALPGFVHAIENLNDLAALLLSHTAAWLCSFFASCQRAVRV
jgi:hypothetical protein